MCAKKSKQQQQTLHLSLAQCVSSVLLQCSVYINVCQVALSLYNARFFIPIIISAADSPTLNQHWHDQRTFIFYWLVNYFFFRFVTLLLSFSSLSSFIIKFLVCYEYLNIMLYHHRVIYDITTNHYHAYSLVWSRFRVSADAFVYRGIPCFQSDLRDIRLYLSSEHFIASFLEIPLSLLYHHDLITPPTLAVQI